jgi:hypothetical protein
MTHVSRLNCAANTKIHHLAIGETSDNAGLESHIQDNVVRFRALKWISAPASAGNGHDDRRGSRAYRKVAGN